MSTRLWDLDYSTGWRRATRGIPRGMLTKNRRPGWHGCQQRGNENKNSTCTTQPDNSEAMSAFFLQVSRLGREVSANQALRIAFDVRDDVVVMVVPETPGCCELPLTRKNVRRQPLSTPSIAAIQLALHFKLSTQRWITESHRLASSKIDSTWIKQLLML